MVFDSGKDKDRTMMGTTPEQAAAGLMEAGADVIGSNCGQGIAGFVKICARLKAAAAGHPDLDQGQRRSAGNAGRQSHLCDDPEQFASYVPALVGGRREFHRRLLRHVAGFHPAKSSRACAKIIMLRLLVIGCPVFQREIELLAAARETSVTTRWLDMGLHERPHEKLHAALQSRD